jgi:hypothetical protein
MQRWHRERHIARRNWRDRARLLDSDLDQSLDRDRQLGRFRKLRKLVANQSPDDGLGVRFPHLPLDFSGGVAQLGEQRTSLVTTSSVI